MHRLGSLNSETFANYPYSSSNSISIGGTTNSSLIQNSLSGIVNRMWFYGAVVSDSDFTNWYSFDSKFISFLTHE